MRRNNLIGADTINIYLSHLFRTKDLNRVEEMFDKFFHESSLLQPNVRTLNILMDGYRASGQETKVLKYFNLFEKYRLLPDKYTFSAIVRSMPNVDSIMRTLQYAQRVNALSAPLLRCVTESLGKLGAPGKAFQVQQLYSLLVKDPSTASANISQYSPTHADIDAVIAAFLAERSSALPIVILNPTTDIEILISNRTAAETAFGLVLGTWYSESFSLTTLACGPKGLCLLLTYLQRLGRLQGDKASIGVVGVGSLSVTTCREQLWARAVSTPGFTINGRIADSLLRCFGYDIEGARHLWRTQLVPLAVAAEKSVPGSFQETAEKALEALMFLAGSGGRADVGLEVAVTARRRRWDLPQRVKLARAYTLGRKGVREKTLISGLLNSGLERSIEAELGVLLCPPVVSGWTKAFPQVRLQFTDNTRKVASNESVIRNGLNDDQNKISSARTTG